MRNITFGRFVVLLLLMIFMVSPVFADGTTPSTTADGASTAFWTLSVVQQALSATAYGVVSIALAWVAFKVRGNLQYNAAVEALRSGVAQTYNDEVAAMKAAGTEITPEVAAQLRKTAIDNAKNLGSDFAKGALNTMLPDLLHAIVQRIVNREKAITVPAANVTVTPIAGK